jgi:hypothetical protein
MEDIDVLGVIYSNYNLTISGTVNRTNAKIELGLRVHIAIYYRL